MAGDTNHGYHQDMSCCAPCHFAEEEKHALPYLLPAERQALLRAHREILAMPEGPLREARTCAHARWEDELFPRRLPRALAMHFVQDHHRMLGCEPRRHATLQALAS